MFITWHVSVRMRFPLSWVCTCIYIYVCTPIFMYVCMYLIIVWIYEFLFYWVVFIHISAQLSQIGLWGPFSWLLCHFDLFLSFLGYFLNSGTIRYWRFKVYILFCSSSEKNHCFNYPWFLLWYMEFRNKSKY